MNGTPRGAEKQSSDRGFSHVGRCRSRDLGFHLHYVICDQLFKFLHISQGDVNFLDHVLDHFLNVWFTDTRVSLGGDFLCMMRALPLDDLITSAKIFQFR